MLLTHLQRSRLRRRVRSGSTIRWHQGRARHEYSARPAWEWVYQWRCIRSVGERRSSAVAACASTTRIGTPSQGYTLAAPRICALSIQFDLGLELRNSTLIPSPTTSALFLFCPHHPRCYLVHESRPFLLRPCLLLLRHALAHRWKPFDLRHSPLHRPLARTPALLCAIPGASEGLPPTLLCRCLPPTFVPLFTTKSPSSYAPSEAVQPTRRNDTDTVTPRTYLAHCPLRPPEPSSDMSRRHHRFRAHRRILLFMFTSSTPTPPALSAVVRMSPTSPLVLGPSMSMPTAATMAISDSLAAWAVVIRWGMVG